MNLGDLFKGKDGKKPQKSSANILSAVPAMQLVLNATKGATDVFSFVGSQVNRSLGKMGVKNINHGVGFGNGFGFGHGFQAGLSVKPSIAHRVQSCYRQVMLKMMMKMGIVSNIPGPLQSGLTIIGGTSNGNVQTAVGSIMKLASETTKTTSLVPTGDGNLSMESKYSSFTPKVSIGSHSEKVISSFLQNPKSKEEEEKEVGELVCTISNCCNNGNDSIHKAGRMRSENNVLQVLLKHQQVIEELIEENEKLRKILIEDLKVSPSKLQASNESRTKSTTPSADCFECRRKQRKSTP